MATSNSRKSFIDSMITNKNSMKQLIIIALITLSFSFTSYSQTDKGNLIVGGSVSFDIGSQEVESGGSTTSETDNSILFVNPSFGYFVIDGLAVGLNLSIQRSHFESDQGSFESTSSGFSVGPIVKYYLENGIFGMGTIGFGTGSTEFESGGTENESKDRLFNWQVGAGYAIFLNDHVAIEPMISYGSLRVEDRDSDIDVANISRSFTIGAGFTIFL